MNNRLKSLLFLIPSLKPVRNGTSALAFQNPVRCIYAAVMAATLTGASTGVTFDLKNTVTALISERDIYTNQDFPS